MGYINLYAPLDGMNEKGLTDAVENNPVLQGWGNKLVLINYAD